MQSSIDGLYRLYYVDRDPDPDLPARRVMHGSCSVSPGWKTGNMASGPQDDTRAELVPGQGVCETGTSDGLRSPYSASRRDLLMSTSVLGS